MIIANGNDCAVRFAYNARTQKTIEHALRIVKQSKIAPYICSVIHYGSAARNEQSYNSDVDLLVVLQDDFSSKELKREILLLKGSVKPENLSDPDVDLKISFEDTLKHSTDAYYASVRRDGVDIWDSKA